MDIDQDSAQVRVRPPLILLEFVLAGAAINWVHPFPFLPDELRFPLGFAFIVSGFSTILYCAWLFKRAHTNIKPWKTTSAIVQTGFYKVSRNPIYVSFIIIGLGVSFAVNSLWIALSLLLVIPILNTFVIQREEEYLEKKFGDEYRSYKQKVRRWL